MFNPDYDGTNPDETAPADPYVAPTSQGQYQFLGYDGRTEVYRGVDGNNYVVGPNGANGLATFVPYTGSATTFSQSPVTPTRGTDPVDPGPTPPPPTTPGPNGSPYPSGQPAPTFTPPPVNTPAPWSYGDFVAPNPNDLNSDPVFNFTMQREQDAIAKRAAAAGMANTGGTWDALMRNAADIAGAGYHDLFNRNLQTYATNRQNSLDQYNTNYGTQYVDPFKAKYQSASDLYNSQTHAWDMGNQYAWANTLFGEQKANDAFDRKFKIYNSIP